MAIPTIIVDLGYGEVGIYIGEEPILGNPYLKVIKIRPIGSLFRKIEIQGVSSDNFIQPIQKDYAIIKFIKRPGPVMDLINSELAKLQQEQERLKREKEILEQINTEQAIISHFKSLEEIKKLKQIGEESKSLKRGRILRR